MSFSLLTSSKSDTAVATAWDSELRSPRKGQDVLETIHMRANSAQSILRKIKQLEEEGEKVKERLGKTCPGKVCLLLGIIII